MGCFIKEFAERLAGIVAMAILVVLAFFPIWFPYMMVMLTEDPAWWWAASSALVIWPLMAAALGPGLEEE